MKLSVKAALFSALIAPGAGHLLLKRTRTAIALLAVVAVALYVLVTHAVDRAQAIVDKIASGEVALDIAQITALVAQQPVGNDALGIELASYALLICWVAGIVDAYRQGRRQQQDAASDSDGAGGG